MNNIAEIILFLKKSAFWAYFTNHGKIDPQAIFPLNVFVIMKAVC